MTKGHHSAVLILYIGIFASDHEWEPWVKSDLLRTADFINHSFLGHKRKMLFHIAFSLVLHLPMITVHPHNSKYETVLSYKFPKAKRATANSIAYQILLYLKNQHHKKPLSSKKDFFHIYIKMRSFMRKISCQSAHGIQCA